MIIVTIGHAALGELHPHTLKTPRIYLSPSVTSVISIIIPTYLTFFLYLFQAFSGGTLTVLSWIDLSIQSPHRHLPFLSFSAYMSFGYSAGSMIWVMPGPQKEHV
jgi:hypothetical protein